jgi:hypothetical protein
LVISSATNIENHLVTCLLVQIRILRFMEVGVQVHKEFALEVTNVARCLWFTPVILAIQEAEIRRVVV